MSQATNYTIIFYLTWCGTETTHAFATKAQYDEARRALDKIARVQVPARELPPGYSGADYYVIETDQRDAFQKLMQSI